MSQQPKNRSTNASPQSPYSPYVQQQQKIISTPERNSISRELFPSPSPSSSSFATITTPISKPASVPKASPLATDFSMFKTDTNHQMNKLLVEISHYVNENQQTDSHLQELKHRVLKLEQRLDELK